MLRSIATTILLTAALPAAAQTDAEKPALARAIERGTLIYAYDQAAWHGTDDMLAKVKDAQSKVRGWIVDGPAEAPELVFYDKAGTQAVYTASFRDNKLVSSRVLGESEDRTLSPARRALVTALEAARTRFVAEGIRPCTPAAFNTVLLPPAQPGAPTLVYFLSPQVKAGEWPLGGHYLIEVAPDGTAGKPRPFTKSCLNMAPPPEAKSLAAMTVSHLLDPTPVETHVFTMFTARLPVMVITSDARLWGVAQDRGHATIRVLQQDVRKKPN